MAIVPSSKPYDKHFGNSNITLHEAITYIFSYLPDIDNKCVCDYEFRACMIFSERDDQLIDCESNYMANGEPCSFRYKYEDVFAIAYRLKKSKYITKAQGEITTEQAVQVLEIMREYDRGYVFERF